MKTEFYWRINVEEDGNVIPVDQRNWPTPDEAIAAAKECIGNDIFVSMYTRPVDAPNLSTWCCDLDLRGRPIRPSKPEREQKASKLRSDGNMHLVKYAKEHYVQGDMMLDLAKILIAWSGLSVKPEDVPLQFIFNHVYNTWVLVVPEHQRDLTYVLRDHFVWNEKRDVLEIKEFIRLMLSSMRWVERTKHPDLPAGDPDILPLDPKATEAGWNEPITSSI